MKKGFTLAEVLITMSIIAVVALLTLPSMIKNYRYKVFSSTLKQTISQLEDAIKSSMADEHANDFVQSTGGLANSCTAGAETGPCYLFNKYLKTSFMCTNSSDKRCVAPNGYKSMAGDATRNWWGADRCYKLSNGATVCMVFNDLGDKTTHVGIDVNGPAQPNIMGIDLFTGTIDNAGNIIDLGNVAVCGVESGTANHINDYTRGCLKRVIQNNWTIIENN